MRKDDVAPYARKVEATKSDAFYRSAFFDLEDPIFRLGRAADLVDFYATNLIGITTLPDGQRGVMLYEDEFNTLVCGIGDVEAKALALVKAYYDSHA